MGERTIRNHRDLDVWKCAMDLSEDVYVLTSRFPKEEMYGLTSQSRRAAVSIVSNIAEGAARQTKKEFTQFIYCAVGSTAEIEAQLELAIRIGYISRQDAQGSLDKRESIVKMLYGLIKSLNR